MEVIKVKSLADAYVRAYNYVMWQHEIVETEDGEMTFESGPLTVVVSDPSRNKDSLKTVCPYNDNFLKSYESQLLYGTNNNFDYTYNERLFKYQEQINQIEAMVGKLKKKLVTRRAIAITWYPYDDNYCNTSVPCLQYMQFKIKNKKVDLLTLWRSRDVLMGMPANMYAMNTLHEYVVEQLCSSGIAVKIGSYTDISVVPHVYFKRDANYCAAMDGVS